MTGTGDKAKKSPLAVRKARLLKICAFAKKVFV